MAEIREDVRFQDKKNEKSMVRAPVRRSDAEIVRDLSGRTDDNNLDIFQLKRT